MPTWSSRLLPSPPSPRSNQAQQHQPSPPGGLDRSAPIDIDYSVPLIRPTPAPRRSHARSVSQPFPALLSSGAKKKVTKEDFLDSDDDDEVSYIPEPRSGSPRKRWTPAEDWASGRCMTCNATVRWPRNVKVFRCTTCLMVNDLEPHVIHPNDQVPNDSRPPPPPPKDDSSKFTLPATPLSIDTTQSLIDRCLTTFLRSQLDGHQLRPNRHTRPSEDDRAPQQDNDENVGADRPTMATVPVPSPKGRQDDRFLTTASIDPERRDPRTRARSSSDTPPPMPRMDRSPQARDRSPFNTDRSNVEKSSRSETRPTLFRPLEDYIIKSFTGCDCLNNSFVAPGPPRRAASESISSKRNMEQPTPPNAQDLAVFELDPKMLLLGDIAENSSWWTGGRPHRHDPGEVPMGDKLPTPARSRLKSKASRIDWIEVAEWYRLIISAGESWRERWSKCVMSDSDRMKADSIDLAHLDREIADARTHAQKTLLKATENLLKRPGRPLFRPESMRFLLILLANPLLSPISTAPIPRPMPTGLSAEEQGLMPNFSRLYDPGDRKAGPVRVKAKAGGLGHHSGIVKRILGLIGNLPNDCHHYLVGWFARYPEGHFEKTVSIVGSFVTYRLTRQHGRHHSGSGQPTNGLVPSLSGSIGSSHAQLHAALNARPSAQNSNETRRRIVYGEDWQIRAAARVMALLFAANASKSSRRRDGVLCDHREASAGLAARHHHGQVLPISSFYNSLLDYSDLVADFETWEVRNGKFAFCQYPFFLSISAKSRILEHDARRQMTIKAREAFFDSILNHKAVSQYLHLKVRRDCLVEDSLRGVSEVVGAGQEEIKKGLRIEFAGEEGVDAGGLRKEWFLLLVREVFDPNHGLFVYDDDSRFCYFNPFCFESSEQFFLVGVLLGLAIYNSTILDVALPPFAFKKLLAAAPAPSVTATSTTLPRHHYAGSLEDLAEFRPALAKGLRALLDFNGDVQETFCYDFVAEVDRYGQHVTVPLCPGGENKPVTNANRHDFVSLYVQYLLDTAVHKQFEPFKRGFFTVCAGNALSLFRPEEIELMVRGSDEPLDVTTLRAVATYENWPSHTEAADSEAVIDWFWDFFAGSTPPNQRKILSFITGSDRIPATGAASLSVRLACLGEDSPRYPIAHTCFNKLGLFRYTTRSKLETMVWGAVVNSEGFGLK